MFIEQLTYEGNHYPKKHKVKKQSRQANVLVERLLADEVVRCCDCIGPCDLGTRFSPCSVLEGSVTVTVLKCTPKLIDHYQPVQVNLLFSIQKEMTVIEPSGKRTPLEFTFYRPCCVCLPPLPIRCWDTSQVECRVVEVQNVCAKEQFICADAAASGHATLTEELEICVELQLIIPAKLRISLCKLRQMIPPSHPFMVTDIR